MIRLLAGLAALSVAAYVLPPPRILRAMAEQRAKAPPVRVSARLEGAPEEGSLRVEMALHPRAGLRVSDSGGGRWLVQRGRLVASNRRGLPPWVPQLEILVLSDADALGALLAGLGVDLSGSRLARCGEFDCFLLGEPGEGAAVWVEKDRFEVARLDLAGGSRVELRGYRDFGGIRFPERILLADSSGSLGELVVEEGGPDPDLDAAGFSPAWVAAGGVPAATGAP